MPASLSDTLIASKNARQQPTPEAWLLEATGSVIQLAGDGTDVPTAWRATDTARFAFHDRNITYGGALYLAIAGAVEDAHHAAGALLEQTITIPDPTRRLAYAVDAGAVLNTAVTLKRVSLGALSDSTHHRTFRYLCTGAVVGEEGVSFKLGAFILMDQLLPKARFLRYRCRHTYKDANCQATSAETTCDKTYDLSTGCAGRDNQDHYGGFPTLLSGPNPWALV